MPHRLFGDDHRPYGDKVYTAEPPLRGIEVEVFMLAADKLIARLGKKESWTDWKVEALQAIAGWLLKHWLEGRARLGVPGRSGERRPRTPVP